MLLPYILKMEQNGKCNSNAEYENDLNCKWLKQKECSQMDKSQGAWILESDDQETKPTLKWQRSLFRREAVIWEETDVCKTNADRKEHG